MHQEWSRVDEAGGTLDTPRITTLAAHLYCVLLVYEAPEIVDVGPLRLVAQSLLVIAAAMVTGTPGTFPFDARMARASDTPWATVDTAVSRTLQLLRRTTAAHAVVGLHLPRIA